MSLKRLVDPRMHNINPWLFFGVMIKQQFGQIILSIGTSCYVIHKSKHYLVTNLHNVTGRNPTTGTTLSDNGGIPDNILASFTV